MSGSRSRGRGDLRKAFDDAGARSRADDHTQGVGSRVAAAVTLIVAIAAILLVDLSGPTPLEPPRASAADGPGALAAPRRGDDRQGVILRSTGRDAERRETLPIKRRAGAGRRVVLSLALPRLRRHDRIRIGAEVATSTTCVTRGPRCIGRMYRFDPRMRARIVLAAKARTTGGKASRPVSRATRLSCGQRRPNRNHHCPLVIDDAGIKVGKPSRLPCKPRQCRLNVVLSAHHPDARGGEVIVVGGDQPNGTVKQDKGRLSAAIVRAGRQRLKVHDYVTRQRRQSRLQASFSGGHEVTYSRRLSTLRRGDVLIVRARQRSALPGNDPYFISNRIMVSSKPDSTRPTPLSKRAVTSQGTVTRTSGFNCTGGPSAFRSPCRSRKIGIVRIKRTPRRPLFVNLVSRTFPLIAQFANREYPAVRVLGGGGVAVQRLRLKQRGGGSRGEPPRLPGVPDQGSPGGSGGRPLPLPPLPPLPFSGG